MMNVSLSNTLRTFIHTPSSIHLSMSRFPRDHKFAISFLHVKLAQSLRTNYSDEIRKHQVEEDNVVDGVRNA